MNIAVIGTGYVGLVTGTCLAESGNQVLCVDVNQEKINFMKKGEIPIYEPHLDVLFKRNIKHTSLQFSTKLKDAVDFADVIFLALPTPDYGDGSADISYVLSVSKQIAKFIKSYKIIANKSTVPVGTADKVKSLMRSYTDIPFDVVSNPEFLREGFAVDDFLKPERVIIGSRSSKVISVMSSIYKPFMRLDNRIIVMDEKSAELTKYAANSFLATKITFMNEMANFCERVGADIDMVRKGIGTDSRIGKRFLFPGIGFGGSCFPKDVNALIQSGKECEFDFTILNSVVSLNNYQKTILTSKIERHFSPESLKSKKFAIWGLSFKPDTDDIREAPSLYIIDYLIDKGAKVVVHDPVAMDNVRRKIGDIVSYHKNIYNMLEGADALVICTEWRVFRTPNFDKIKSMLKKPVIFDGRNLYQLEEMKQKGISYFSIGRNDIYNL